MGSLLEEVSRTFRNFFIFISEISIICAIKQRNTEAPSFWQKYIVTIFFWNQQTVLFDNIYIAGETNLPMLDTSDSNVEQDVIDNKPVSSSKTLNEGKQIVTFLVQILL